MTTRTSGRAHRPVNYDEKQQKGGQPAWAKELGGGSVEPQRHNENNRPTDKQQPARKSAPAAVAVKGRNAGLTRLPIEDAKAGSKPVKGNKAVADLPPAAAGKQVLPGVVVKGGAGANAAAAAKSNSGSKGGGAQPKAAAKPDASKGRAGSSGGAKEASDTGSKGGFAGGKRKAASAGGEAGGGPAAKPAAKAAAAGRPAAAPEAQAPAGKRVKPVPAPAAAQQEDGMARGMQLAALPPLGVADAEAAAAAPAAAGPSTAGVQLPSSGAEALVDQYAANFRELQGEYLRLQALYEDLKAAKIDEEVAQLLEQQNKFVSDHGQQAAALADHYKGEAEHQAALAAELGGGALVERCAQLQADLLTCQQALLDKEAECVDKGKHIAELEARLAFLERFARVYDSSDKCIQTDPPPQEAASAQFPSIQSSGLEMLHAHALVPEGAGGGSIYKRPKAAAAAPASDPSYTLPGLTPRQEGFAAAGVGAAAPAQGAAEPLPHQAVQSAAAAGGLPLSGSDMELTGPEQAQQQPGASPRLLAGEHAAVQGQEQQQHEMEALLLQPGAPQDRRLSLQLQPQRRQSLEPDYHRQQRRHSLQPVSGRLAHAAAGPAPRPGSAESQVQACPVGASKQQAQQQRAAGGSRRLSAAPPPTDRQLQFSSLSSGPAHVGLLASQPLPAVPEEEQQPAAEGAAAQQVAPLEAAVLSGSPAAAPAASQVTAAAGLRKARAAAPTPGTLPTPPRELALAALTGLVATPLHGGFYRFTDPRYGFVFELGPAPRAPDSATTSEEDSEEDDLLYRPITFGTAAGLLTQYFKQELSFPRSQRPNFHSQLMDCLAQKK